MDPWDAEGFEWDEDEAAEGSNVEKLSRRGIRPWEVDEIFLNGAAWKRNKQAGSAEWLMIGQTDGGRCLTILIVVKEEARLLRAFGGWPCTIGELTFYRQHRRGEWEMQDE